MVFRTAGHFAFFMLLGCGFVGFEATGSSDAAGPDASDLPDAGGVDVGDASSDGRAAPDSGMPSLRDTGLSDVGSFDTGSSDVGSSDTGLSDSGARDSGTDAPTMDAGDDAGESGCLDVCAVGEACFQDVDGTFGCVGTSIEPPRNRCGDFPPCDCDVSSDCSAEPDGHCVSASYRYCGGIRPPETNSCRYPECTTDAECEAGTPSRPIGGCLPRGVYDTLIPRCAYGVCRTDADCMPGGTCDVYDNGCGYNADFFCRYPLDVCVDDTDCPRGFPPMICIPETDLHGTRCVEDLLPS